MRTRPLMLAGGVLWVAVWVVVLWFTLAGFLHAMPLP